MDLLTIVILWMITVFLRSLLPSINMKTNGIFVTVGANKVG